MSSGGKLTNEKCFLIAATVGPLVLVAIIVAISQAMT